MDYSKVTAKELLEKEKAIFISLGGTGVGCMDITCKQCPLFLVCNGKCEDCEEFKYTNIDKYIKIIMDYEIPVDWSKVPIDTKILVQSNDS